MPQNGQNCDLYKNTFKQFEFLLIFSLTFIFICYTVCYSLSQAKKTGFLFADFKVTVDMESVKNFSSKSLHPNL